MTSILGALFNPAPQQINLRAGERIAFVRRRHPPVGWALPGGFVDDGETVEAAARRETHEETGLELDDLRQFHVYSDPGRDPRGHTVSVVFTARGRGAPSGGDDAAEARVFSLHRLPEPLVFDHAQILKDYAAHVARRANAS